MALEEGLSTKPELSPDTFASLIHELDNHIDYAASQNVTTSISVQNGFHLHSEDGEHEVVHLGEQQNVFAASHAKLAVVAFMLSQGPLTNDDRYDVLAMLRESHNGAFIRQKRGIETEVVSFAKSELGIDTNILTLRDNNSSLAGQTTARDSLKMFLKTIHISENFGRKDAELSNAISTALSENTSRYGVRVRLEPYSGIRLLNKTGDEFGYDDPEVGEAVHHDVGVLLYKVREEKRRLAYSITSSAVSRLGALKADRLNQLAGATLIEAIGGTSKSALKSTLQSGMGAVARRLLSR